MQAGVSGEGVRGACGVMLPVMVAEGCFDSCWQLADSVLSRSIRLIGYGRASVDPLFPREKWVRRLNRLDNPENGRPAGPAAAGPAVANVGHRHHLRLLWDLNLFPTSKAARCLITVSSNLIIT